MANNEKWPKDELKCQYVEVGDWARHYSNVRATVTPVLAGLSLGILQFAIKQKGASLWIPLLSSAMLWIAALLILVWFTDATRRYMKRQRYIQNLLFPNPPEDHNEVFMHRKMDQNASKYDRLVSIGIFLSIIYGLFLLVWLIGIR